MDLEKFLSENKLCNDRFTFDEIFRFLLRNNFSDEEAKDTIIFNCSLSTMVFQERIHNCYYKNIKTNEKISKDLLDFKNAIKENI